MSLAGDRLVLMQALGDLGWVRTFTYPPNGGYSSGDCWPLISRIDYPNRFGGLIQWDVQVVLHQDVVTAEKLMDTHIPGIRAALANELIIRSVTPQLLQFEQGSALIVAVIAGTREES